MTNIFIDAGHGGSDPGATGNGLREKDLTLDIALKTRDILNNEYEGHSVKLSRTSDETLSLSQRTNMANDWGADYLVSVHINASGGAGFESYTYNGSYSGKAETNRLGEIVHDAIVAETEFNDRGKKEANFHMVRESAMPAVLTENGFIDNTSDAAALKTDAFLTKVARGHAKGLANALDLTGRTESQQVYVEVITDSLWTYNSANWDDRAVIVSKGEVFTVVRDKFPVGVGQMYKIKSGLFITANPNYVSFHTE
ncbi:N-acetylmuramoyl-L-alanine amidase [Halobacillus sp. A5]|uniref:N-acetylmuramoyl-L-alanine amidase n=1 Tax=Halobacillus sp. A5 TaxID=2880263 RepID=UPI0020A67162|nr:N-acetylmuramoyl-L-alanine amidase [Halobacillus sp. A5]MCP3026593.1 N-acetylmuramoyl-L-alanine amidase [Halobacillus sp. A5]